MTAQAAAQQLKTQFGDLISEPVEFRGEISLQVRESGRIAEVCAFCKNTLGFDYLVDLSSVDHYGDDPRWSVVYELYALGHRCYLRLKTSVSEEQSELPTVTGVWKTADWHEREVFDMMGIRFAGHPDLRRILMWDGYPHHPLKKDFPLAGKPTDLPDVAFSDAAPMEGGPFVTRPGLQDAGVREPRVRQPEI
ncbi:MAG: NADH-quinone oxidoreductase subunit C [Verrucomicrobia bacterium]|jgi:NADH-quinone oxidoreductase subunit C|nr:NADH-quinone oxidoreductase subunit C [Verrucomicrobiota bacterium]